MPMPTPLSPLSSSSTFCLELPVLPPGGVKPLPLPTLADEKNTHWCESTEPGQHAARTFLPSACDMDDAYVRVLHACDPSGSPREDTVYGPMRITSASPDALGGEFTFVDEDTGDHQIGYVSDQALRIELSVPTSDGTVKAVVSRIPPRVKDAYAAAKDSRAAA